MFCSVLSLGQSYDNLLYFIYLPYIIKIRCTIKASGWHFCSVISEKSRCHPAISKMAVPQASKKGP